MKALQSISVFAKYFVGVPERLICVPTDEVHLASFTKTVN